MEAHRVARLAHCVLSGSSMTGQALLLVITEVDGGVRFGVYVKPRASRSKLLGVKDGVLTVALRSPPVDGAANAELIAVVAKELGVRKSDVTIVSGATGRRKVVAVARIGRTELSAKLERGAQ